jgi:hypothetical protein
MSPRTAANSARPPTVTLLATLSSTAKSVALPADLVAIVDHGIIGLELADVPLPTPNRHELLVRVEAGALNFSDLLMTSVSSPPTGTLGAPYSIDLNSSPQRFLAPCQLSWKRAPIASRRSARLRPDGYPVSRRIRRAREQPLPPAARRSVAWRAAHRRCAGSLGGYRLESLDRAAHPLSRRDRTCLTGQAAPRHLLRGPHTSRATCAAGRAALFDRRWIDRGSHRHGQTHGQGMGRSR